MDALVGEGVVAATRLGHCVALLDVAAPIPRRDRCTHARAVPCIAIQSGTCAADITRVRWRQMLTNAHVCPATTENDAVPVEPSAPLILAIEDDAAIRAVYTEV